MRTAKKRQIKKSQRKVFPRSTLSLLYPPREHSCFRLPFVLCCCCCWLWQKGSLPEGINFLEENIFVFRIATFLVERANSQRQLAFLVFIVSRRRLRRHAERGDREDRPARLHHDQAAAGEGRGQDAHVRPELDGAGQKPPGLLLHRGSRAGREGPVQKVKGGPGGPHRGDGHAGTKFVSYQIM